MDAVMQIIMIYYINSSSKFMFLLLQTDEFNRVIIPVKRGEENTDYVNASFIDVSVEAPVSE